MSSIVFLDDNFVIRQTLSIALHDLSKAGATDLQLYTSANGVEGLGFIYVTTPELIIVDTTLPKYSGREVLDYLRLNSRFNDPRIKVLVLKEKSDNEDYPPNFIVLDKSSQDFFGQLMGHVGQLLMPEYKYHSAGFNKVYSTLVWLANLNDLNHHRIEAQTLFSRIFNYLVIFSREIAISLLFTFLLLFKERVQSENIDQEQQDLVKYRVRYYPTLVATVSAFFILTVQFGSVAASQTALLLNLIQPSAADSIFVVDTTADNSDFLAGDGYCDTDDGVGDGPCTLRAAIEEANALVGTDTINFSIPGTGPHTIQPATVLPTIIETVHIDGSTQPGASCDPMSLQIEVDGSLAGTMTTDGLTLSSTSNSSISGLVLNNFRVGIVVSGTSTNNTIRCNILGLDPDGNTVQANYNEGIELNLGADSNTIGGATDADRNIISGNRIYGIQLNSAADNTIQNNYIGTDVTGLIMKTNGNDISGGNGINITDAGNGTQILDNVITGSVLFDIYINNSDDVTLKGNYVGTDRTGNTPLNFSSSWSSLSVKGDSDNFILGGYQLSDRNVFSEGYLEIRNDDAGTQLTGAQLINNYFGLGANGTTRISTVSPFFNIDKDTGTATVANVLIDANYMVGNYDTNPNYDCRINMGGLASGSNNTNFTVTNNYFGYDSSGMNPLGVCSGLIMMSNKIDGGTAANNKLRQIQLRIQGINLTADNNQIYDSPNFGMIVSGNNAIITDNLISNPGTTGMSIGSSPTGVLVSNNTITGAGLDAMILTGTSTRTTISQNSIYNNDAMGIDLNDDGFTANDAGDADTGPNSRVNFPALQLYSYNGTNIDVYGTYNSVATTYFRLEFFASAQADPSGYGEGQTYLGSSIIQTDGSGNYDFSSTPISIAQADFDKTQVITATATRCTVSNCATTVETSEFSNAVVMPPILVNSTDDDSDANAGDGLCNTGSEVSPGVDECTLRAAIEEANALGGADSITFTIGSGYQLINLASDLPAIEDELILDASTQPGANCTVPAPMIELDFNGGSGLYLNHLSTVRGFIINGFENAIFLDTEESVNIECNIIGADKDGTSAKGNENGIYVSGDGDYTIGGSEATERNLISGNDIGIYIESGQTEILGNLIGTDIGSNAALANNTGVYIDADAVEIGGETGTTPGGPCTGSCNLISGNGVGIYGEAAHNLLVTGNFIGTNLAGTSGVANQAEGISLENTLTATIGGTSASSRNLISGNAGTGIKLAASGEVSILGNYIGVDTSGSSPLGNGSSGIEITELGGTGSNDNIIGGTDTGEANVIAANDFGVMITGQNTNTNHVSGNYIGTDITTTADLGNNFGVLVDEIGAGSDTIDNNVIANSNDVAVEVRASNVTVTGNQLNGNAFGIVLNGSSNTHLEDNEISDSIGAIWAVNGATQGSFISNTISSSSSLAIDLDADEVTVNDAGDTDSGSNNLQNYPVISSAEISTQNNDTVIDYLLDTNAGDYLVEFYTNTTPHASGHGEGSALLCSDSISHGGGGEEAFSLTCPTRAPVGSTLTAIATVDNGADDYGDSSEFAQNVAVTLTGVTGQISVTDPLHTSQDVSVTLNDADLNTDSASIQTVTITLDNNITGEEEEVTLTETANASATFTGSLPTTYGIEADSNNNGSINVKPGDGLNATYQDLLSASGSTLNVTDTVTVLNAAPEAVADAGVTSSGNSVTLSVLENDYDAEGQFMLSSLAVTTEPTHGSIFINGNDGSIRYTAASNYVGADGFIYQICDHASACDSALVTMSVNAIIAQTADITPQPSPTITPTATPTLGAEPTLLRPTPTIAPPPGSTTLPVSAVPTLSVLPETGGGQFISALFQADTLGEVATRSVVLLPATAAVASVAYTYPRIVWYAFAWIKGRKKVQPWGIIYDREHMTPIPFATVRIYQNEHLIKEAISDLGGRYGFVADQGQYTLAVEHPNYNPVRENLTIQHKEEVVNLNIIMPLKITQGVSSRALLRLRLREELAKINMIIFTIGVIVTIIATIVNPVPFNFIVLAIYTLQLLYALAYKLYKRDLLSWGYVYETDTQRRVPGAFVRLYSASEQNQLDIQMTDKSGRYGFIVEPGPYLLSADHPDYIIPSRKNNAAKFFVSNTGKLMTVVNVRKHGVISIIIPADRKSNDDHLPSPFS